METIYRIYKAMGGVNGFGVISICLFFVVFGCALIWAFCQKKSFLTTMESLPLKTEEVNEKGDNRHV